MAPFSFSAHSFFQSSFVFFLTVCCRNAGDIFVSVKRMSEVAIRTFWSHNVDDVSLLLSQWREMKLVFSSSFSLVTDAGGETLLKVVALLRAGLEKLNLLQVSC